MTENLPIFHICIRRSSASDNCSLPVDQLPAVDGEDSRNRQLIQLELRKFSEGLSSHQGESRDVNLNLDRILGVSACLQSLRVRGYSDDLGDPKSMWDLLDHFPGSAKAVNEGCSKISDGSRRGLSESIGR